MDNEMTPLERALKEVNKKSYTEQLIVIASTSKSAKTEWVKLSEAKRIIRELVDGVEKVETNDDIECKHVYFDYYSPQRLECGKCGHTKDLPRGYGRDPFQGMP